MGWAYLVNHPVYIYLLYYVYYYISLQLYYKLRFECRVSNNLSRLLYIIGTRPADCFEFSRDSKDIIFEIVYLEFVN